MTFFKLIVLFYFILFWGGQFYKTTLLRNNKNYRYILYKIKEKER